MILSVKEFEGRKFYYYDFGSEAHGRTSFRLWINHKIIERLPRTEEGKIKLEFPLVDAEIVKTEKGNYVLRPAKGKYTFNVYQASGYRGDAFIKIVKPKAAIEIVYYVYQSPLGSTGIDEGKLLTVDVPEITVVWHRTGRTYGAPHKGMRHLVYVRDGEVKEEEIEVTPEDFNELEKNL